MVKKKAGKSPRRWMQYWHGLGRCRDPQAVQVIETAEMLGLPIRPGVPPECREYVYASPSWEVAAAFSVLSGGQAVCEVKPGALQVEADTDFPTLGVRFHGPVKVASVKVLGDAELPCARQVIETLAGDYLWTDSSPQYGRDGYLRTPPMARERGYGDEDFRWLGRWFPFQFLYQQADGTQLVFDEDARTYVMFPPGHPDLKDRRRVPSGSLEHAWRRPGVFPHQRDLMRVARERLEANDSTRWVLPAPWDW
ncbi:hypothetical protein QRB41_12960 [Mycobacterium avium subsp. hominissuis]|nr:MULTISPECIES: hypothetical protein [Mycobacteriaceae]MDO2384308.1 hypothetical protein [Mycobacterium avium subsp. hominissuis]MDO2395320.1 hypothetical protein [Mycobacterium avium subsp. hominissuis]